jgi:succinoglycan biosynthesis transport protein ExoP
MELKLIYQVVKRNLLLVLISTSLSLTLSTLLTLNATPIYNATTQLFVSTPASALDISSLAIGSSFGNQRVSSYAKIVNSEITLSPVIQRLGLNVSPRDLANQVQVQNPLDTVLLDITVRDKNPQLASDIANAIGEQFSLTVGELELGSDQNTAIKVSVTIPSQVPLVPTSPNKRLNAFVGFAVGLLIGVGLALLRLVFDNKVKNQSHLGGHTLLANFMFSRDQESEPLISTLSPYHERSESFAQLRLSFQNSLKVNFPGKKTGSVIVVTSALPSEGKSTVVSNLAISLSKAGKKVLLIDGDLRRPTIEKLFNSELISSKTWKREVGFTQLLSGNRIVSPMHVSNKHKGLSILSAGTIPPMPAELLLSAKLGPLLANFRKKYDYILIDSAPLLPASDSAILASQGDGVVIVVRANSTRTAHFNRASNMLQELDLKTIGVVLNMIPIGADGEEYGYGYGYGYSRRYMYGYSYKNSYHQNSEVRGQELLGKYSPIVSSENISYLPEVGSYLPVISYSPRLPGSKSFRKNRDK